MGDFLQGNWFWILLIVFFIWMHRSGMGCGGHGGGHRPGGQETAPGEEKKRLPEEGGHQH
ncbi:MAG TPA: hypothetical protein VK854_08145 [Woeseiaceae bacterium]|nr:hypothetical protein [Woeseiaceae bacterium]